ncbi:helix-hairpin-helix domain-containing protein [Siccibacter turicensis]|uniref:helix-hairpin-helix domain-containing protein n=1 Tax=Siccibacter turicensis TaxID=357233 RepID=UPI0004656E7F|nr:topoisomerase DNA-binding C4 zinc finger domain-containing protein [Siccibacter turicensis]
MSHEPLYANGRALTLDKRVGKGGEGEVFSVSNLPGYAVKRYLNALAAEREPKIRALVASQLADSVPTVAFPCQVVENKQGKFVGFLMRLVDKHKEIHELQTPTSRQKHFPKADYRFIVRVALNVARVMAQLHAQGCVVGDINQRGILVSPEATVVLIDADSFQVNAGGRDWLCAVGVPEYTPPELQGKTLKAIVRTADHDAFGLAVCLFQLLCMDRHPFSGSYTGEGEMPLEKAIEEFRFAYSARATGMEPPPGTVRLKDFPASVHQLFEEAFSPANVGKRPAAADWVAAMQAFEGELRMCSRNKLHHYARHATECPWCRMESRYGRPLFLNSDYSRMHLAGGQRDARHGLVLDLAALMAAVNGVPLPGAISVPLPPVSAAPPPQDNARLLRLKRRALPVARGVGAALVPLAALGVYLGMPWFYGLALAALGLTPLGVKFSADRYLARHQQLCGEIVARVATLQQAAPLSRAIKVKAEIYEAVEQFRHLSTAFSQQAAEWDSERRTKQLDDHLVRQQIRRATLSRITTTDCATLASWGFTTALDIKQQNVRVVPGIGPIKSANLHTWLQELERGFSYRSAWTAVDHHQVRTRQNEILIKQQGMEERIKKSLSVFQSLALETDRWKNSVDSELTALFARLAQCEADIRCLGLKVPPRPPLNPIAAPTLASFQQAATIAQPAPVLCPRCQSPMVRRVARRGPGNGRAFWGCGRYPGCNGTRPI